MPVTEKKELILKAAKEMFSEKGYHKTTSEEIAKRAGVGKGTIYQYFQSKQDIYMEIQIGYIETYADMLCKNVNLQESFEDNVRRLIHIHLNHINQLRHCVRGVFMAKGDHILNTNGVLPEEPARVVQAKLRMKELMDQLVERAVAKGELRPVIPKDVNTLLVGVFVGFLHQHYQGVTCIQEDISIPEADKQRIENTVVEFLFRGIGA